MSLGKNEYIELFLKKDLLFVNARFRHYKKMIIFELLYQTLY